ncbi:YfmQ family protein [Heyndrickxia sp. FSL K6-6286]|uniref:YfmQ family protein n=1 Tax=Heyndrickxia TaxID=2837504 RepID=UPI000717547F|nr:YfmQ family protein [Heyndrickxia oleronia]MBU5210687.1 YfmQ family protein [Heyndrickxia oleronia]NYV67878.1 hypothetical protein [Bacillus sp. Gen3]
MTWFIVVLAVLLSAIKIIVTCPPTFVVEWFIKKFELHTKLNFQDITLTFNEKLIEGDDKREFVNYYNEATFLEKYYIFPGNEKLFLHPENNKTPFVIVTKKGKKDLRLFIFPYGNHVDVVKQYKKKIVAYSVQSDHIQKLIV